MCYLPQGPLLLPPFRNIIHIAFVGIQKHTHEKRERERERERERREREEKERREREKRKDRRE